MNIGGSPLGKIVGGVFVGLYALLFGALMTWGGFSIDIEQSQQGILVDFGTSPDVGSGEEETTLADDYSLPEPTSTPQAAEPVQTQQVEESPVVEEANITTDTSTTVEEQKEVEPTPPAEEPKPREVNQRALFPGAKQESQSASEGATDNVAGNAGYIGGTESDTYEGTGGEGGFEPDWNLEGRRPRTEFPRPKYVGDDQGVVVMRIWVNGSGDVMGADYEPKGSTVKATSPLVNEARKAALGVKFNESEQDIQEGFITYRFTHKY